MNAVDKNFGSSVIRAALEEGDVHIKPLAERLGWTFPRVYSRMKTYAKCQKNKELTKISPGVYKLTPIDTGDN